MRRIDAIAEKLLASKRPAAIIKHETGYTNNNSISKNNNNNNSIQTNNCSSNNNNNNSHKHGGAIIANTRTNVDDFSNDATDGNDNNNSSNIATNGTASAKKKKKSYYLNWICTNSEKTSQKTLSNQFECPWCERNYLHLDSLMHHLRCTHSRFTFTLQSDGNIPVIDMAPNGSFDGSYCGFKYPGHDLRCDFRFVPKMPKHLQPITRIIFFRPKRALNNGHAFGSIKSKPGQDSGYNHCSSMFDDGEADVDVCSGRLYYHTSTCLPVKPNEVDIDSEADIDPDWLRERTQLMIDEFTDVNEGEKEILKLWNLHMMKNYRYKGDSMIRKACFDFVASEGQTILDKNLFRNFTLHLSNLFEFGLISSQDLLDCVRMMRKLGSSDDQSNQVASKSHSNSNPIGNTSTTSNNNNNNNNTTTTTNSNAPTTAVAATTRMSNKLKRNSNSNDHCPLPPKRALLSSHVNQ